MMNESRTLRRPPSLHAVANWPWFVAGALIHLATVECTMLARAAQPIPQLQTTAPVIAGLFYALPDCLAGMFQVVAEQQGRYFRARLLYIDFDSWCLGFVGGGTRFRSLKERKM